MNTGTPAPHRWTAETIPAPLVAILDEQAGKEHSEGGAVRQCAADMLNRYDELRDAETRRLIVEVPAHVPDADIERFKQACAGRGGGPIECRRAGGGDA